MHGQSYARARSCLEPWSLCAALGERATWSKLRKAPALPLMSGRCRHLRLHQSEPPLPCPLWRHASALSRPPPLSIASIQLCSRLASPRSTPLHSRPITAPPPPSYSAFAYSRLHTSHMAVMRRLALLHRWAMGRPHQSMTHDGPSAGPYSSTPICDAVEASAGIYAACLMPIQNSRASAAHG